MLKKLFLITLALTFALHAQAQAIPDSLIKYRNNKQLLPAFELVSLQALWHYPELLDTKVRFKEQSLKTSAACRPVWYTLFRKRTRRTYNIFVNNNTSHIGNAILPKVPQNAQIGLLGHELGHVVDYSERSSLGVAALGFSYLFIPSRSKIEKRVDRLSIEHHLGENIYEFDNYIQNSDSIPESYKAYKRKVYYSAEEIKILMQEMGM